MSINFFYASIGTILGSIYFVLSDNRILLAAITCLFLSSSVFTSLQAYRKEIISLLFAFLLVFFNFNLRSEHLQYINPSQFNLDQEHYLEIVSEPEEKFFKSNFILQIKAKDPSLGDRIKEIFIPQRLLAKAESSEGLSKGDLIKLIGKPEITAIKRSQYYKASKVFFQTNNQVEFISHKNNIVQELQRKIQRYYAKTLSDINATLTSSLVLGSRVSKLPYKLAQSIRNLGLGHFFAASGFHLLVLSMTLLWLFNLFKSAKLITNLSIIAIAITYSALAGFSPSIVRAAILITLYLALDLIKRKPKSIKLLCYLAALILVIDPYTMYDLGFQFSYLATFAILVWAKPVRERLDWLPSYFADIVSVSLSVQIMLVPLIIYQFGNFQPWTLIANIIFTPLLSLITVSSFIGLSIIVEPLLNLFRYLVEHCQLLPWIQIQLDIGFDTFVLLMLFTNLIAYSFCKHENFTPIQTNEMGIMIKQWFEALIKSPYSRSALISSSIIIAMGLNANPPCVKTIEVKNGHIKDQQFTKFMTSSKNYDYFKINNLSALAIKDRSSIDKLASINELKEVNLLILPNLGAKDIYLETLLDLTKPQFVISSVRHDSKRATENLAIIGARANTIVNNGRLNIGHDKFWSMTTI